MTTDGFGSDAMDAMVGGEQAKRRLGESMKNVICNDAMDNKQRAKKNNIYVLLLTYRRFPG